MKSRSMPLVILTLVALVGAPLVALAQVSPPAAPAQASAVPGWVLLAWPLVTAAASLLYPLLDSTTKGHALLSMLAALGIDVPKILTMLQRMGSPAALAAAKTATMVVVVAGVAACSPFTGGGPAVGPSVDLAVCVFETVSTDEAAHKPWSTCIADAVSNCGADAASVIKLLDAHKAAEVREGFVPKPVQGQDGG